MLMRTRITWLVAIGFAALVALLAGAGALREGLLQQRLADTALAGQSALWAEALDVENQGLGADLLALSGLSSFTQALAREDVAAATRALSDAGLAPGSTAGTLALVAVFSPGRETLFFAGASPENAALDAASLDRAMGGASLSGLRFGRAGQAYLFATRPLPLKSGPAVLVVGRSAQGALQRLARRLGGAASLVNLRGQLAETTDGALWKRAALEVSARTPRFEELDLDDRIYSVANVPVQDISGATAGALVVMTDATTSLQTRRTLGRLAIGVALVLAGLGVVGLNLHLWRSFRPLQSAIDALQALSRGDVSVHVDARGRDEIGRIGEAVQVFRRDAHALMQDRALRERVRRRQESVIQRELRTLAEATDSTSREELLALLHEPGASPDRADDSLRRLAHVMGDLTRRIIDQHQRLSTMVVELREALVTKTKLASLQQELHIAAQVQLSMLPHGLPKDPRVDLHCHITPARDVGGDFYDYFPLDDEHYGIVIADVSGKGTPAALFMAITRTLLKATAQFVNSPSSCLQRLNELLAAENEQMLFVTVFYGVLHLPTGEMNYVNAGHNPPYVIRRDGRVDEVPGTHGLAVAILDDVVYKEGRIRLDEGDTLFLFTDGVTEACDPAENLYGEARLIDRLRKIGPEAGTTRVAEEVFADVRIFENGAPQADDITCVALRWQPAATPNPVA